MSKITFKEYLIFAEAWLFVAFARLILLTVPFKRIVPLLGHQINKSETKTLTNPGTTYKPMSLSIERAARYSPWRAMCFEQAIAAKLMLKIRNKVSTINFGVMKDKNGKMIAHAWIICDNEIITGGLNCDDFVVINRFQN